MTKTPSKTMETQVMQHLQTLVSLGERPVGSANHQAAAAYIRQVFARAGLEVSGQRMDYPDWSCTSAHLSLSNGDSLPLMVNPFSPSVDVSAPMVPLGTIAELESANLTGKVAVLYGELSKSILFPINFLIYNPERDQTINRLLLERAPLAIIVVSLQPFKQESIFEDEDMLIPSVTVSAEVGLKLLRHPDERVTLRIGSKSTPSYVETIIGTASQARDRKIIICAHYDTKFGTPGAYDNASGIAVMLTLAERLARQEFASGLEFVAWGDEEYGARSDAIYVEQTNLDEIVCAINVDGVGQYTGTNTITMLADSSPFREAVTAITKAYAGVEWVGPWYASNHSTYAMRGVPSIALSSTGVNLIHLPMDTLDWINPAKLLEVIHVGEGIIQHIHHQPVAWSRPPQEEDKQ